MFSRFVIKTLKNTVRHASKLATLEESATQSNPLLQSMTKAKNQNGILKLRWDCGKSSKFSSIFLRDSCRCPECYDQSARQRKLNTVANVPLSITPADTIINDETVDVVWPDGHQSSYSHQFLWSQNANEMAFEDEDISDISHIEPRLWNKADIKDNIQFYDFNEVLDDEHLQLEWFQSLVKWGFTILQGADRTEKDLFRLRKLFGGYIKSTHYGETFHIISKPDPNSLAYKTDGVLPHMDLPHLHYSPGLQVLHCLEQAAGAGGDNTLVDGYFAAEQLKQLDRDAFDVLCSHNVTFRDIGTDVCGDFETYYERPIIGLKNGKVDCMGYSNWLRDYKMDGSAEVIHNFFESYYKLTHLITDPKNSIIFKLNEGDMLVFNNQRMLHGRTGFSNLHKQRDLFSCYFEWDGIHGYMRRLKRKLDNKE